jgi:hypothetical protein
MIARTLLAIVVLMSPAVGLAGQSSGTNMINLPLDLSVLKIAAPKISLPKLPTVVAPRSPAPRVPKIKIGKW